ncbi:MAG: glycine cleavage system aminomethyltransferase GcvT [Acidaminococcales bacterium]|nr:glycine cleavage system aminomethyltransferase GcvT [Acidaminococcales bacterium]
MTAKKTPLYQIHLDAGAKMVEFGGWLMPVQYSGIVEEHHAVRQKAGLFDVSHMGEFSVKGKDAQAFIQKLVTNDIAAIQPGQAQYSPMCYENGGVVDDLLIYKHAGDDYMLVVNGGNIDKDWQWVNQHKEGFAVEVSDLSGQTALIALQGPLAPKILGSVADADTAQLGYYRFLPSVRVAGVKALASRTGYTGEDGFELYCAAADAAALWRELLRAGAEYGLLPAGLGARDTLRFEACLPLYGHELSAEITPIEAGLGMFVKPDKGLFNGQAVLAAQKKDGAARALIGLEMTGRGIARADYPVWADSKPIGRITTGSVAPTLGKNLGLALVDKSYAQAGRELFVEIRGKQVAAKIVKKPFYKREGK